LTHQIDLARLRDEAPTQFADTVIRNLEQAIGTISDPTASEAAQVRASKAQIEDLAAAARQVVLTKLQLADKADVVTFRLAMDLIEYGRQIAQLARAIAKTAEVIR
jgi:phosphate:Na+ symporter